MACYTVGVSSVHGPDLMAIQGLGEPVTCKGLFLSVTTADAGIEADRVALIEPPVEARLLDGEVINGHLLNRPIGLFDVERSGSRLTDVGERVLPERAYCPLGIFGLGEPQGKIRQRNWPRSSSRGFRALQLWDEGITPSAPKWSSGR